MSDRVVCLKPNCDRSWPRDPVLEVPCPTCQAEVGQVCRRPSGHPTWQGTPHADRDIAADRGGHYGVCPTARCGLKNVEARKSSKQRELFA